VHETGAKTTKNNRKTIPKSPDYVKTAKSTMSELMNHHDSIYEPPKTDLFRASL
jgi:hypothetical protein